MRHVPLRVPGVVRHICVDRGSIVLHVHVRPRVWLWGQRDGGRRHHRRGLTNMAARRAPWRRAHSLLVRGSCLGRMVHIAIGRLPLLLLRRRTLVQGWSVLLGGRGRHRSVRGLSPLVGLSKTSRWDATLFHDFLIFGTSVLEPDLHL